MKIQKNTFKALMVAALVLNLFVNRSVQAQTGTSTNTGSLAFDQAFHQAFLQPNGKVLIMGGDTDNGPNDNGFAGSQIWDPTTGNWTIVPMSPIPEYNTQNGLTTTVLTNGQLLVVGGYGQFVSELFDPVSGIWTNTQPMNTPRCSQAATLLPNGKVLITGGYNSGNGALSSVELYDPSTGAWTIDGNLITARGDHSATLLPNGTLLIAGGDTDGYTELLSTAELYDPGFGPTLPITLSSVTKLSNGAVQIAFTNAPGASFTTLSTTNLTLPVSNWPSIGQPKEGPPGYFQFLDLQATNYLNRFYLIRSP